MKIWLIQTGEDIPLGDNIRKMRTAVLADELVQRGHEVTWWASSFSHLRKKWMHRNKQSLQLDNGVHVELLRGRGYKSNVSLARVIDHRIVAAQFSERCSTAEPPDIIVCSLPPYDLAYQAARYSRNRGIPLLIDARDCWPDIFLDVAPAFLRPLLRLVLQSEFRLTRNAFRQADAITAVSKDILRWATGYCDRDRRFAARVFHLGFRAPSAEPAKTPDWLAALDGRFIVAFIGTFSAFHNPVILTRAARLLQEEGRDDVAIVIAGAGGDLQAEVKAAAAELTNVTMPGWLDQEGINALLGRAAVGVCPTGTDARLFPNKAFLYFSRALPVISAFQGELRQVVEDDGLGYYFDRDDAAALVRHIKSLCDNPGLHAGISERVRQKFSEQYDEQFIYSSFADHIEMVANAGAPG